ASALVRYPAELLTAIASSTLRRNVLGAIASAKNDCNFPQRSDDKRDGARNRDNRQSVGITAGNELEENATYARRYPYGATQKKTVFPLTNSFRKGHIDQRIEKDCGEHGPGALAGEAGPAPGGAGHQRGPCPAGPAACSPGATALTFPPRSPARAWRATIRHRAGRRQGDEPGMKQLCTDTSARPSSLHTRAALPTPQDLGPSESRQRAGVSGRCGGVVRSRSSFCSWA